MPAMGATPQLVQDKYHHFKGQQTITSYPRLHLDDQVVLLVVHQVQGKQQEHTVVTLDCFIDKIKYTGQRPKAQENNCEQEPVLGM